MGYRRISGGLYQQETLQIYLQSHHCVCMLLLLILFLHHPIAAATTTSTWLGTFSSPVGASLLTMHTMIIPQVLTPQPTLLLLLLLLPQIMLQHHHQYSVAWRVVFLQKKGGLALIILQGTAGGLDKRPFLF